MSVATIYDQIKNGGILFPVRTEPVFTADGQKIERRKVIINTDNNRPLAIVGSHYKIISNEMVVDETLKALEKSNLDLTDANVDARSAYDGARCMVTLTLPAHKISVPGDKSETSMQFVFLNSYDASWRYTSRVGGFRHKCANGQFFGKKIGGFVYSHRIALNAEHISKRLVDMAQDFVGSEEWFGRLVSRPVTDAEVHAMVRSFLKLPIEVDLPDSRNAMELLRLWNSFALEMGRNAYALYNTFTDFIAHRKRSDKTKIAVKVAEERRFAGLMDTAEIFS